MSKKNVQSLSPLTPLDHAGLMTLVQGGDVAAVRRYFDESLHGRTIIRPDWAHLRVATIANNVPMAKLLVTWGAHPTKAEVQDLIAERGAQATHDVLALRLAGVRLHDIPALPAAAPAPAKAAPAHMAGFDVNAIPVEWRTVLAAIQKLGAPEALIAGGALRDTYNNRLVKDVDIFLADRFMSKRFIKKVFAACGLQIHTQTVSGIYKDLKLDLKPTTAEAFNEVTKKKVRDGYGDIFEVKQVKEGAEAWSIIAGPDKTEYNIIFIKGDFGKRLKQLQAQDRDHYRLLMERFDIGLCRISYNGKTVYELSHYRDDVKNKRVTLVRPNDSSRAHIERVMAKYPDFTPCHQIVSMLGLTQRTTIIASTTGPVTVTKTYVSTSNNATVNSYKITFR